MRFGQNDTFNLKVRLFILYLHYDRLCYLCVRIHFIFLRSKMRIHFMIISHVRVTEMFRIGILLLLTPLWRIQASRPPRGPDSLVLTYKIFETCWDLVPPYKIGATTPCFFLFSKRTLLYAGFQKYSYVLDFKFPRSSSQIALLVATEKH